MWVLECGCLPLYIKKDIALSEGICKALSLNPVFPKINRKMILYRLERYKNNRMERMWNKNNQHISLIYLLNICSFFILRSCTATEVENIIFGCLKSWVGIPQLPYSHCMTLENIPNLTKTILLYDKWA